MLTAYPGFQAGGFGYNSYPAQFPFQYQMPMHSPYAQGGYAQGGYGQAAYNQNGFGQGMGLNLNFNTGAFSGFFSGISNWFSGLGGWGSGGGMSATPVQAQAPRASQGSDWCFFCMPPRQQRAPERLSLGAAPAVAGPAQDRTEAVVAHPAAQVPQVPDRIADSRETEPPAVLAPQTSPGVDERAPEVLPMAQNAPEQEAQRSPIWNSFISNFQQCAPGCVPANYAAYGARSRPSCHTTSEAIDVGAILCDGNRYEASDRGRFEQMVDCMRTKMGTLYRNGADATTGHRNHAHFSNGCAARGI